jgi:type VI protein secretion system component Hcp
MLVDSIRGDQVAPHDREFRVNSFSSGLSNTTSVTTGATGIAVGKASFSPVKVSMRFHAASNAAFSRSVAAASKMPSVEIRLYNSTRMFYKWVFENVYFTSVATEGADDASQQVEFVYTRVKWFAPPDPAGLNAPVQAGCWDLATAKAC